MKIKIYDKVQNITSDCLINIINICALVSFMYREQVTWVEDGDVQTTQSGQKGLQTC